MTSYITSTDVLPIQVEEVSNTTSNPVQSIIGRKRKNSSCGSLRYKMAKIENNADQAKINRLFNKIFSLFTEVDQQKSSKLIALDPSFSEEHLKLTLNPLFTKTLLERTKKESICSHLEQNPCCGDYWKELHVKSNSKLSLQDLQKLYFCLEDPSLTRDLQNKLRSRI
jgi:hypothetical protein